MRVLGIIPSRYESSRFPGKPLIDLAGKTMIQRVYEGAQKSSLITDLIVATDDERIFKAVNDFGGQAMMTSSEHKSGTERCGEVISKKADYDVIINIQGDEPLIDPAQIDGLLNSFKDSEIQIATLIKQLKNVEEIRNPNRIKVIQDGEGNALYFSRSPIPHISGVPHEEWLSRATFYKHIGVYAWRHDTLKVLNGLTTTKLEVQESLEQLRWLFHGYKIRCVETTIETPNIDVPEDVETVLQQLKD